MLKMIGISFKLALLNIRANLLHTLLSVLGIVIGVAALVTILSFIDGIEQYAREEIASTSSLHSIVITTNTSSKVDGIRMEKEAWGYLTPASLKQMEQGLSHAAKIYLVANKPQLVSLPEGDSTGILFTGAVAGLGPKVALLAGRLFTQAEQDEQAAVVVLNEELAAQLSNSEKPAAALGQQLSVRGKTFSVIGVVKGDNREIAQAIAPITHFSDEELKNDPPVAIVEAEDILTVTKLKEELASWLKAELARQDDDFSLVTNEFRLAQLNKSFLVFKVVMGLITGIAVLVGGIGIMNVLLISVTERTTEIGIRKATGAKKRDIMLQFLSESVTISSFGSLLGIGLGVVVTLIAVPLVTHFTEAPFEAAFTANTMLLIAFLAVFMGVVFGTYPAVRAAGLDPVEAIRRE